MKITVFKLKEILNVILFFACISILLVFSKSNFDVVKNSLDIFMASVFPSLFPFVFFTDFILRTNTVNILSKYFGKAVSKIFKVSNNSVSSIVIGFLCGFPLGAKTVATSYENGKITRSEANNLLKFVNNCNPAFILSTIGIGSFGNINIGITFLISHICTSLIIGIFSNRFHSNIIHDNRENSNSFNKKRENYDNITFFDNIKISILNSLKTLGNILGFIIIFNLLFSILKLFMLKINVSENVIHILSAIFEVTCGAKNISLINIDITTKLILVSFALGFSGLCIISQIYSTICTHKFSLTKIILYKLLHGIISCIITYILIKFTGIVDISKFVFNNNDTNIYEVNYMFENMKIWYISSTLLIVVLLVLYRLINLKKVAYKKK